MNSPKETIQLELVQMDCFGKDRKGYRREKTAILNKCHTTDKSQDKSFTT